MQLASLDHALCHASEAEGAFTRTHNKVVETICQESGRAGFKLDCNLGRVPTFPNPAWNPTSGSMVKQFQQVQGQDSFGAHWSHDGFHFPPCI